MDMRFCSSLRSVSCNLVHLGDQRFPKALPKVYIASLRIVYSFLEFFSNYLIL